MQEIIAKIIESLENGNILLVLVFAIFALLLNGPKILEFVESRKRIRIEKLKEAISNGSVKGATKVHLENELESEYFKLATGLYLEREFRESIISLHEKAKGEIKFVHFKRALPHLKYSSEVPNLVVKITLFEKMAYYFNIVGGSVMTLLGVTIVFIPTMSSETSFSVILYSVGMGVFLIAVSVFMLYQAFPMISARYVRELIEKNT